MQALLQVPALGVYPMRRLIFSIPLLLTPALHADEGDKPAKLVVKPDALQTLVNPQCSHCRDEAKRRAGEIGRAHV